MPGKRFTIPIEEVAMFIFFIFAIVTISLPFMALFIQSKGFRWILVLVMIWISAVYLGLKAQEDTESLGGYRASRRRDVTRVHPREVDRAIEILARGETGLILSQDMVYERLGNIVRKLLIISDISEKEFMESKDETHILLRRLLKHEKRKGSLNLLRKIGLYRDQRFISDVKIHLEMIERWLNENI